MNVKINGSETNVGPIFIVGTQRSGTTLLRLILNAHSRVAIPEEARFLSPLLKDKYLKQTISGKDFKNLIQYLANNEQFRLWNYDTSSFFDQVSDKNEIYVGELIRLLYESFCIREGKDTWGDKSLFFSAIPFLHKVFPSAKFIHIVRDGRDVFDSWRKMDSTKSNVAVIALDWRYKLFKIESAFDQLPAVNKLCLRYEDLMADPEEQVRGVCEFIGIKYEIGMLEFYKTSKQYIGDHHSDLIFQSINNKNVNKWEKNLTKSEATYFELLTRNILEKYQYNTRRVKLTPVFFLGVVTKLLIGLPVRAGQVLFSKLSYERALKKGTSTAIQVGSMPRAKGEKHD